MEDFVTYELAVKLKEKGYPQLTFGQYDMQSACYVEDGRFYENGCITEVSRAYSAPRISEVLKWLREEKKRYLGVSYVPKMVDEKGALSKDFYFYTIQNIGIFKPMNFGNANNHYKRFEKAALAGINYIIDNLI